MELKKTWSTNTLQENDQLNITWTLDFSEPKPLTPVEQVLKIFNDTIDYWKGYHVGNYCDENSGWD